MLQRVEGLRKRGLRMWEPRERQRTARVRLGLRGRKGKWVGRGLRVQDAEGGAGEGKADGGEQEGAEGGAGGEGKEGAEEGSADGAVGGEGKEGVQKAEAAETAQGEAREETVETRGVPGADATDAMEVDLTAGGREGAEGARGEGGGRRGA